MKRLDCLSLPYVSHAKLSIFVVGTPLSGIKMEEQNDGKVRIPSNSHFTDDNLNIYSHTNSPLKS